MLFLTDFVYHDSCDIRKMDVFVHLSIYTRKEMNAKRNKTEKKLHVIKLHFWSLSNQTFVQFMLSRIMLQKNVLSWKIEWVKEYSLHNHVILNKNIQKLSNFVVFNLALIQKISNYLENHKKVIRTNVQSVNLDYSCLMQLQNLN